MLPTYMSEQKLPQSLWLPLSLSINRVFKNKEEWLAYLKELGISKDSHVKTATEGALLGAVIASEQDNREFVTKRKISGSTRSNEGRRCRDTFASLKKTCRKLGIRF